MFKMLCLIKKGVDLGVYIGDNQILKKFNPYMISIDLYPQATGPELHLCDDGPGISPGNAAQIFDPFFTTKRGQGGTGMGLTILRNMLSVHGGEIALDPSARGACFVIRFPMSAAR